MDAKYSRKIVLVGEGGVGKTTFLRYLRTGEFEKKYLSTIGVEVHPLRNLCVTPDGEPVDLFFWDTAGQEKFSGLRDGYYIQANLAVVMIDLSSKVSYKTRKSRARDVQRVCPGIPILQVATKSDVARPRLLERAIKKGIPVISTKSDPKSAEDFLNSIRDALNLSPVVGKEERKEERKEEESQFEPLPDEEYEGVWSNIWNEEEELENAWEDILDEEELENNLREDYPSANLAFPEEAMSMLNTVARISLMSKL